MTARFEPEIEQAASEIERAVAAGRNDSFLHAWHIADAVEQMLERYFPNLATANALDPQETIEKLLEFYDSIHSDTANQPNVRMDMPAPT